MKRSTAFKIIVSVLLLLLLAAIAYGQTSSYREYRGVRLGMTAAEARAKLGTPAMMSADQDYYVFSANESTQIMYDAAQKVVVISTDYTNGVGAPDYRSVVGEGLLERPDGSMFRMIRNDAERFWISYNKSTTVVPVVTITLGAYK
ncbi:MAG TPA: hypothetical protein VHS05_18990 [Pyrinomonadaceae bacterium]|jgi:hypothetical protein|nr:hypothetical protein [Pyrinomonadaceae bacterium]